MRRTEKTSIRLRMGNRYDITMWASTILSIAGLSLVIFNNTRTNGALKMLDLLLHCSTLGKPKAGKLAIVLEPPSM